MTDKAPLRDEGGRRHLKVHPDDNVTTILDAETHCTVLGDGLNIRPGIPFGHKVAVTVIRRGEAVVKYGVVIGHALDDIAEGEHVHVHNLA